MSTDAGDDLGLRDSDLTASERAARDARLRDEPEARDEHAFGMGLFEELGALPDPEVSTSPAEVRRRIRRPGGWWAAAPMVAALAAAGLVWVLPGEGPTTRDRGVAAERLGVVLLDAVARDAEGRLRPLRDGGHVGSVETVLFRIRTDTSGHLRVIEDEAVIHPLVGAWAVEAGAHSPGGEQVLGFRTDAGPGAHRYRAELCLETGDRDRCADASLTLVWDEP